MRGSSTSPILVVPTVKAGRGGGHLARCADLVRALRSCGRSAYLHLPPDFNDPSAAGLVLPADRPVESETWSFIVLDLFRPSQAELRRWSALAPLVGLDAGGAMRDSLDYLLDLLPGLPSKSPANQAAPFLLSMPEARRPSFLPPAELSMPRILVSFGAEDPAGLSVPAALSLAAMGAVDLLFGSRSAGPSGPERETLDRSSVRMLGPEKELRERLAEYDLLVSHFGLTVFEALGARVPVLLVSPTSYHRRLAVAAGLPEAGVGRAAAASLGRRLLSYAPPKEGPAGAGGSVVQALTALGRLSSAAAERNGLCRATQSAAASAAEECFEDGAEPCSLAGLVRSWTFPSRGRCPLCGGQPTLPSRSLARFPGRTYRRCPSCGMVQMIRPDDPPIEYGESYFFADYKRQYGQTYLEDFPKLKAMGAARVSRIASLLRGTASRGLRSGLPSRNSTPRLLDVGCAYGPFLAAARDGGFACAGIDPSEGAARYVSDTLGIPALRGLFPDSIDSADFANLFGSEIGQCDAWHPAGSLDAVTLWYVVEHFSDVGAALRVSARLLRPGGVLAFSTPSFSGISARFRRRSFLERSPQDHWTLWEVGRTAEFLRPFGFTLVQTHVTGHHPERFPLLGRWAARKRGMAFRLLAGLSTTFGLGDTFEAYAIKTEERG